MKKNILLAVVISILVFTFAAYANNVDGSAFESGIGFENEVNVEVVSVVTEFKNLNTLDGKPIDDVYLKSLENMPLNRIVGRIGEPEKTITPRAVPNPPAPITSRLIEELGVWPDSRSLALDQNNKLYVLVREVGGPGQYYEFYFKFIDWQDGTRTNYNNRYAAARPAMSATVNGQSGWWAFPANITYNPTLPYKDCYFTLEAWWGKPWPGSGMAPQSLYMGNRVTFLQ